jgi:hypothetical protein
MLQAKRFPREEDYANFSSTYGESCQLATLLSSENIKQRNLEPS